MANVTTAASEPNQPNVGKRAGQFALAWGIVIANSFNAAAGMLYNIKNAWLILALPGTGLAQWIAVAAQFFVYTFIFGKPIRDIFITKFGKHEDKVAELVRETLLIRQELLDQSKVKIKKLQEEEVEEFNDRIIDIVGHKFDSYYLTHLYPESAKKRVHIKQRLRAFLNSARFNEMVDPQNKVEKEFLKKIANFLVDEKLLTISAPVPSYYQKIREKINRRHSRTFIQALIYMIQIGCTLTMGLTSILGGIEIAHTLGIATTIPAISLFIIGAAITWTFIETLFPKAVHSLADYWSSAFKNKSIMTDKAKKQWAIILFSALLAASFGLASNFICYYAVGQFVPTLMSQLLFQGQALSGWSLALSNGFIWFLNISTFIAFTLGWYKIVKHNLQGEKYETLDQGNIRKKQDPYPKELRDQLNWWFWFKTVGQTIGVVISAASPFVGAYYLGLGWTVATSMAVITLLGNLLYLLPSIPLYFTAPAGSSPSCDVQTDSQSLDENPNEINQMPVFTAFLEAKSFIQQKADEQSRQPVEGLDDAENTYSSGRPIGGSPTSWQKQELIK